MSLNTLWKWSKSLIQRLKTISCKVLKAIFCPKQIVVTIVAFLIFDLFYHIITINIGDFNPVARSLDDLRISDLYYQGIKEWKDSHKDKDSTFYDKIVIVDVTDLYDHDSIATVLEKIDSIGPRAIDVDIIFNRPDCDGDTHLREVAEKLKNAVFSYWLKDFDKERKEYTRQIHSYFAKDLTLNEGFVNISRHTVREVPLTLKMGGDTCLSVIARMMDIISQEKRNINYINYMHTRFRTISYNSVQDSANFIENKIVFLGSAYGMGDISYTPLGPLSGVEVQCYALKTMIDMDRNQLNYCTEGIPFWLLTILFSYIGVCCVMEYKEKTFNMKEGVMGDLLRTTLVTSIFVCLLMVVYSSVAFWFFYEKHYYFELIPTLSVIALATTSRDLVLFCVKHEKKTFLNKCKIRTFFKLKTKR